MELRLLDFNDLHGVALIRDKLELSAAFLVPYLLQLALSADLKVRPRHKRDYIGNISAIRPQQQYKLLALQYIDKLSHCRLSCCWPRTPARTISRP